MERRQALKWGALVAIGAAGGLGSAWTLARDAQGRAPLDRALADARRLGKPVLVLVGPEPPEGLTRLGDSFGSLVEGEDDEFLHDLLLCELCCATPRQVFEAAGARVIPDQIGLLECTPRGLEWKPVDFVPRTEGLGHDLWLAVLAANKAAVRSALAHDDGMLKRRAEAVRAARGPQVVAEFTARMDRGEPVQPDDLLSMSALLRVRADWPERVGALNQAAFSHFSDVPPRGSRWAGQSCAAADVDALPTDSAGVRYDLQRRVNGKSPALRLLPGRPLSNPFASSHAGILCGMSFGGAHGGRFLLFYIDEP